MVDSTTSTDRDPCTAYPRNLQLPVTDVDAVGYERRLLRAQTRLFVNDCENEAGAFDLGPSNCQGRPMPTWRSDERADKIWSAQSGGSRKVVYTPVRSVAELEAYLLRARQTSVFFLHQKYSWGQLQVSAEFLKRLFTSLRVHPEFLEVLLLFGAKTKPDEQSFSAFFSHCRPLSNLPQGKGLHCSHDIGYNIKYVAPHGRSQLKDPFSVRETGIYHGFDVDKQQSRWLFVQASDHLRERLNEAFRYSDRSSIEAQIALHGIIFQGLLQGQSNRAFCSLVTERPSGEDIVAGFGDIQALQRLTDKLHMLIQVLQRNIEIAEQVQHFFEHVRNEVSPHLAQMFEAADSAMRSFILQHRVHKSRIQSLIDRAGGTGMLVQGILDIRATESNAKINTRMGDLAERTARETRSMSLISLISAIFLPAMFLATIFGTNFFDYENGRMRVASNFWVYIVLVVAMSGITVLLWLLYQRKKAKSDRKWTGVEAG
ncbi:hypothetical protein BJY04DRAFT_216362 [Aspergillus karnatakaensis]|uniref:uncharacterized protein n=1 Tax=Aspergillus karnatakaensis TaxID=1810916 RepID=UPI003CCCDACD